MALKKFVYIRVSTKEQNIDRQLDELRPYADNEDCIFIDKLSGKDFNRPQYITMKSRLREGDTLTIKSLDRLGRNYTGIKDEWHSLTEDLHVRVVVLDMPCLSEMTGDSAMHRAIGNIVFELLAFIAENERTTLLQRQAEGIAAAKKKGKKFGRPAITRPTEFPQYYKSWKDGNITAAFAMRAMGLKPNTFYKMVAAYEGELERKDG